MKPACAAAMNSLMVAVSGAEPVNDAEPRHRTEYPPCWSRVSRWVRGRACWRCELCGVKNGPPPNLLTVHHLDGNKWNLLPWNLAALCQSCHREVEWTLDFCQSTLTDIYPEWLRQHVSATHTGEPTVGSALVQLKDSGGKVIAETLSDSALFSSKRSQKWHLKPQVAPLLWRSESHHVGYYATLIVKSVRVSG